MLANLTEEYPRIKNPDGLLIELMEHQKTAIYSMWSLEQNPSITVNNVNYYHDRDLTLELNTNVGVLSDRVGSGKTLMVLGLIRHSLNPPESKTYFTGTKYLLIKNTSLNINKTKCNLIIIPAHLRIQWEQHIKYLLNINYYVIGSAQQLENLDDINNYQIILLCDSFINKWYTKYENTRWSRIFIDEADSVKTMDGDFKADFLWLVTATPNRLKTSSSNKFNKLDIFSNKIPWVMDHLLIYNSTDYINQSIKLPPPKRITIQCLTPHDITLVQKFIPKGVLQMINAGDTKGAIRILNCNTETNESIIKVISNQINKNIENLKIDYEHFKKKKDKLKLIELEKLMNTQINRLTEIKKKVKDMNDQICLICMGGCEKPAMLQCCHNMYCFECIMLVTKDTKKCPVCRSLIYQNSITLINKKLDEGDYQKKEKYDSLLEIIGNNINGKFMVFSNFTETFNKIQELLDKHHISYSQLKGSAQEMTKTIEMVKNGKIKVLMLNANYQAGVNLEMITDLVFFHRASPQTEQQIIGRSHRLKRTDPLNIYYLLHQGENDDYEDIDIDQIKDLDYLEWLKN